MVDKNNPMYDEISGKIKRAGYKLTPQREVTVETIIENESELLTAEELFVAVKGRSPAIGLATVYRTLDILLELAIVQKIPLQNGMSRYELVKTENNQQSFYLLCVNCGQSKELNDPTFEIKIEEIENKYQFKINTHQISFHGLCQACQESGMMTSE